MSLLPILSYQPLELGDLLADDVQAGAPERLRGDVHAEAGGKGLGVRHAGGGEQVVVLGAESVRFLQITSVQS